MVLKCTFELTKAINVLVWPAYVALTRKSASLYKKRVEEVGHVCRPAPVGRLMISGCGGPTEKLSSFVDKPLQQTKVPEDTILVSMD